MSAISNEYTLSRSEQSLSSPLKINDLLSLIFTNLEGRELCHLSLVCHQWKRVIDEPKLWQTLIYNCFNFSANLDRKLWKAAFKHSFLFSLIDAVQSDQGKIQKGNWQIIVWEPINKGGKIFNHIIVKQLREKISYKIRAKDMDIRTIRIDRNYVFCLNSEGVIYFWNYKNLKYGFHNFQQLTTRLNNLDRSGVNDIQVFTNFSRFNVHNGYIFLTYGIFKDRTFESVCEIFSWRETEKRYEISVSSDLFINAHCLEADRNWFYAFKDRYLCWNLQKRQIQSQNDAEIYSEIPFGHNGKFDFTFFNRGINFKNLLFSMIDEDPHVHIIIRDRNLQSQVVKSYARCGDAQQTSLFENLLRLCLIPRKEPLLSKK